MIYGYARVSTQKQSLERQLYNIGISGYACDRIFTDKYTGKTMNRAEFKKLLAIVKPGDTIVFDSVSRMSRNSAEGVSLYDELFDKGVDLVFLNEPQISTRTYREAMEKDFSIKVNSGDADADTMFNAILEAIHNYTLALAHRQIVISFDQAEKEVADTGKRIKDALLASGATSKLDDDGNFIPGKIKLAKQNQIYAVKKATPAKVAIKKHYIGFGGSLNATDCMKQAGISRGTFYKYLAELQNEEASK